MNEIYLLELSFNVIQELFIDFSGISIDTGDPAETFKVSTDAARWELYWKIYSDDYQFSWVSFWLFYS